jgi:hypothetical protein
MTTELMIAIGTFLLVAVTAVGVLVAVRGVRDQMWILTFSEYTKRYAEIMDGLPFEARRPGGTYDLDTRSTGEREQVLSAMRRYLNLCSEELHLRSRGVLDNGTWRIWRTGIEDVARMPFFVDAWRDLRSEYKYYGDFCQFVDELLEQRAVIAARNPDAVVADRTVWRSRSPLSVANRPPG